MGVSIWNPCQPCNNLVDLKKQYGGKITFCGGIDSQFVLDYPGITTTDVRAEVRKRIDEMANNGGYIAAPSHDLPFNPEIVKAMHEKIAEYGRIYYNQSS